MTNSVASLAALLLESNDWTTGVKLNQKFTGREARMMAEWLLARGVQYAPREPCYECGKIGCDCEQVMRGAAPPREPPPGSLGTCIMCGREWSAHLSHECPNQLAVFEGTRVLVPQQIATASWLNEPGYESFRKAYAYAETQARAIPALAKCSPEELYCAYTALLRGTGFIADALEGGGRPEGPSAPAEQKISAESGVGGTAERPAS